ncbi:MAG: S8 family serine peptidase, partial [Gammaproteobacteria bacterium]|nr:S8 family serine peptidase [Gammaproteobacteria bacterium]
SDSEIAANLEGVTELNLQELRSSKGLLLKFSSALSLLDQDKLLSESNLILKHRFNIVPGLIYAEPSNAGSIETALLQLADDKRLTYIEPDYKIKVNALTLQQAKNAASEASAKVAARDLSLNGNNPHVVAVLDTGIDFNHIDLQNYIWMNGGEIPRNGIDDDGNGWIDDIYGWNFVENDKNPMDYHQHGTHVAGIIAGLSSSANSAADGIKLMALRVLDEYGVGSVSNVLQAFEYILANNIVLSNNSWGLKHHSMALFDALQVMNSHNHLLITAAGNNSQDVSKTPFYPASYKMDNLLSVASIGDSEQVSEFSNYGADNVELAAPGENIVSTIKSDTTGTMSGTSMAAAFVSSLGATLQQQAHELSGQELKQEILKRATISETNKTNVAEGRIITNSDAFFNYIEPDNTGNNTALDQTFSIIFPAAEVAIGEKIPLDVKGGVEPYHWTVNNAMIASIDENGVISGLTVGSAGIIVTDSNGVKSDELIVNVVPMSIVGADSNSISMNQATRFSARGGIPPFTWEASDNSILSYSVGTSDTSFIDITPNTMGAFTLKLVDSVGYVANSPTITISAPPLQVTPTAVQLSLNQSHQLIAQGGNSPYNWLSSDSNIVTVNNTGMIKAVAAGDVNIIVTDSAKQSQTVAVSVLNKLSIDVEKTILAPGDSLPISVLGGSGSYTWVSSDSNVVSISSDNLIVAANTGFATITASDDNGTSGSLEFEVRVVSINTDQNIISLASPDLSLSASGGREPYKWAVNNSSMATIDDKGNLHATTTGWVNVLVTDADGFSDSLSLFIDAPPLAVSHSNVVLGKQCTAQLSATGGDGNYQWTSSDESVATVTA